MDDISPSSAGRLLQMTAADTANALAPMTDLVRCTNSFMMSTERRWRRPAAVETKMQSSAKYDAAIRPWVNLKTIVTSWNCIRCRMGSKWMLRSIPVWCGPTFLWKSQRALLNSVLSAASSADRPSPMPYSRLLQ